MSRKYIKYLVVQGHAVEVQKTSLFRCFNR